MGEKRVLLRFFYYQISTRPFLVRLDVYPIDFRLYRNLISNLRFVVVAFISNRH